MMENQIAKQLDTEIETGIIWGFYWGKARFRSRELGSTFCDALSGSTWEFFTRRGPSRPRVHGSDEAVRLLRL